jgi:OOP family OmpA-OmpF porin
MLYTLNAGLAYYFGRAKDSDGDGVPDSRDMCPNTPLGVKVDADGCPLDADGDGVPDYLDKCPNTPTGVKVDATGCPLDADGDGVPDYLDKCPNTPTGVKVDANGCPLDSDGDGVPDYLDKCPNTPLGVQVDADGCPIKKETVVIVQPPEIESLVLSGDANFEFNKSKLLPNAYPVLDSLVGTMLKHREYKWEIGGYTDKIGSDNYNIKLSQRRAKSVEDYLVSKGVAKNSLKIVGYGKANPIATNETPEGRSMNRRVEIKVLSKK